MSSPFRHRTAQMIYAGHHGPNMTPMVDVVMVILIFFMASASLLGPELMLRASVAEKQADASGAPSIGPPSFLVRLRTEDGIVVVDGLGLRGRFIGEIEAAARAVADQLRGVSGTPSDALETPIVIDPDPDVPYASVILAHDACLGAGFERVGVR